MVALVNLGDEDESQVLGVGEQMMCWLLGTYQLKQPLLVARSDAGLPALTGLCGLNCESLEC